MKFNYFYQQLISHISVLVLAFIIVAMLFTNFIEKYVYESKIDELTTYGQTILTDLAESPKSTNELLGEYANVLESRQIHFSLFNEKSTIIYTADGRWPDVQLEDEEWKKVTEGKAVVVRKDFKRFREGATFVILPYFQGDYFVGGILLAAPISGLSKVITQMNQSLWKSIVIAVAAALLLSFILAKFYVKRINALKKATSKVATGNYAVEIPVSTLDEFGELAGDFNEMVKQLEQSAKEIELQEDRRRQFMADVSHELKTPLTTIHGMIEGLENDMISPDEKKKALSLTKKETKRLIRLVNENLDYEKIRSNQVVLQEETIELAELYAIVKEQLEPLANEKNNQIVTEVPAEMTIKADYDRMLQIIINIVKNSIQFTENGVITLSAYETAEADILQLTDTGIGMEPAVVENIWERFYKAGISRTANPYGEFGLGLSIVKELVHVHGGTIHVASKENEGTTFTIELPKKHETFTHSCER